MGSFLPGSLCQGHFLVPLKAPPVDECRGMRATDACPGADGMREVRGSSPNSRLNTLPHPSPLWDPGVHSPGLPSPLQCPELWVLWDPGHMQGPGVHQTPEPDYSGTPWGGWGGGDSWREHSSCPIWPTPGVWHSLWAQVQTTVTLGEGSGSKSSQAQLHPVGQRSRA